MDGNDAWKVGWLKDLLLKILRFACVRGTRMQNMPLFLESSRAFRPKICTV